MIQRLVHGCGDPLGDQAVQVNRATQQLQDTGATLWLLYSGVKAGDSD